MPDSISYNLIFNLMQFCLLLAVENSVKVMFISETFNRLAVRRFKGWSHF